MKFWEKKGNTSTPHPKPEGSTHKPHPKPECVGVETMLKELDMLVQQAEALKESIDSNTSIEEIKKTKEALQGILHKHGILRYNLKEWESRSKNTQRIDKIAEKLKKGGNNTDLSIDELHVIHMTKVFDTEDGVFNFKPTSLWGSYHAYKKLRSEEKQKEDYARIYGCKPEQVTSKPEDVFKKNSDIIVFIGEDLNFTNKDLPETLKHVSGRLKSSSTNEKIPKNLEYVGGNLDLGSLTSAEGLVLPKTIGGDLNLRSLREIPTEGLVLPEKVGGHLDLGSLRSAEGLVLPKTIGGRLDLGSLRSAEGLKLPETVGGYLNLYSLRSANGLEKLNYAGIIGDIVLGNIFPDTDKAEVEKIKTKQREKGINVNFTYI